MENKRLKVLVGLLCALICALFLYRKFGNDDIEEVINYGHSTSIPKTFVSPTPENTKVAAPVLKPSRKLTEQYLQSIGFKHEHFDQILAQKKLVKDFKAKIKLEIDLPKNMVFIPMDLEDNIAGIYGSSLSGDKNFAVLASARGATVSEVVDYLEDSKSAFPFLGNHELQPSKVIQVDAPAGTGLNSLQIIPSSDYRGEKAYAALASRKDGKGSYLFLWAAPGTFFDQNETGLDQMLESLKANP